MQVCKRICVLHKRLRDKIVIMGKDRLKRIMILLLVAVLFFFAGKVFANWLTKNKVAGASINLPTQQIGEKISDLGEKILGKAVEVLPGGGELKEKMKTESKPTSSVNQTDSQTVTQTEKVEIKTQEIIEIIKELPAAELDNIKKQIFKDFCQKVMEEKN